MPKLSLSITLIIDYRSKFKSQFYTEIKKLVLLKIILAVPLLD